MHKAANNLREAQSQVIDRACEAVVRGEAGAILGLLKACSFGQTISMAERGMAAPMTRGFLPGELDLARRRCKTP